MKRIALAPLLVVALLVAACGSSSSSTSGEASSSDTTVVQRGYRPQPAREVGKLTMLDYADDPAGVRVPFAADPGELLLVYFGYLSCPDICPLTMGDTAAGLEEVGPELAERIEVGFVTVDMERDSGVDIVEYMDHFFPPGTVHAYRPVDEFELNGVSYEFGAKWQVEPHEPGAFYGVAHSGSTYAVDDKGDVVWEWPFGTTGPELAATFRDLFATLYPGT